MTELQFVVAANENDQNVRQILRARGVSVRIINRLKRVEGGMRLNHAAVARTIDLVRTGDIITLCLPNDTETLDIMDYNLDVLYKDEHILVINKPPTLAMHPTHNHQGNSLANAVAGYLLAQGQATTFRPVGRLDKGTSGVVVCALHAFAASKLNGTVRKTYFALVQGCYEGAGTFDNAIYRPKANCTLRACRDEASQQQPGDEVAITHWETISQNSGISYLKIWLETGRTHQIRAHFAHHGTPLLGDDYYGAAKREEPGHFLHCGEAVLIHPVTGEKMVFKAPLPEHMAKFL